MQSLQLCNAQAYSEVMEALRNKRQGIVELVLNQLVGQLRQEVVHHDRAHLVGRIVVFFSDIGVKLVGNVTDEILKDVHQVLTLLVLIMDHIQSFKSSHHFQFELFDF